MFSIRQAATANLTNLIEVFGVNWAKIHIIPKIVNLGSHKSYLYRMTALFAMKDMCATCGVEVCERLVLPIVCVLFLFFTPGS